MKEHYLLTASKVLVNLAGASLLMTITACCLYLSVACIEILTNPDYNCTPVKIEDKP